MARRSLLALAAAVACTTAPLPAQRLYRLEVSAAGGYHHFDANSLIKGGFGPALRLGYWIWGPISLEAEGTLVPTHTNTALNRSLNVGSVGGWGLVNVPLGFSTSLFFKAGFTRLMYGGACPGNVSIPGYGLCGATGAVQGGAGMRIALSPTLFMRYEGLVNYSQQAGEKFLNVGIQGGVSLMIGSRPLLDSDGDRVYDRHDQCPDTRLGALVDERGCPTDQDGDQVPDGLDRCPGSPAGALVDAVGCTFDTDEDGVLDGLDQCQDTPKGAAIRLDGCPEDSDGDGVFDGLDRCTATPVGAQVDALGCPSDADGDGVADGIDQCADTRRGLPVDAVGCPSRELAVPDSAVAERVWVVPGMAFPYRSARLSAQAHPILDSVVTRLVADPRAIAEVFGFAHDGLVPADNTRLSQRRAEAVRAYIISRGIIVTRVTATGLCSSRLVVEDTTQAARTANRRTEIRITRPTP